MAGRSAWTWRVTLSGWKKGLRGVGLPDDRRSSRPDPEARRTPLASPSGPARPTAEQAQRRGPTEPTHLGSGDPRGHRRHGHSFPRVRALTVPWPVGHALRGVRGRRHRWGRRGGALPGRSRGGARRPGCPSPHPMVQHGLVLESPEATVALRVPPWSGARPSSLPPLAATTTPSCSWCVKSQDTDAALTSLAAVAPPHVAVVCVQNGVENERRALRVFPNTYGLCVMCPATYLEPGRSPSPTGRRGRPCSTSAAIPRASTPPARDRRRPLDQPDRPPTRCLVRHHAVEVLQAAHEPGQRPRGAGRPVGRGGRLASTAIREGEAALDAAGIAYASWRRTPSDWAVTGIQADGGSGAQGGSLAAWPEGRERSRPTT